MNADVLIGGTIHGYENVDAMLVEHLENKFECKILNPFELAPNWVPARLVIAYTCLVPDGDWSIILRNAVESGTSHLVALHLAAVHKPLQDDPTETRTFCAISDLIGASFTRHDPYGPLKVVTVSDGPGHGMRLPSIQTEDEPYEYKIIAADLNIHQMRDGEPFTWSRMVGNGRVFYTGLGHDKVTLANPEFGNLLRLAASWASEG